MIPGPETLRGLQALILDCDGVLTPGDLFYDQDGRRILRFSSKDGFGLALLGRAGVQLAVLSGRATDIAEQRLRELGFVAFEGRCRDKAAGLLRLCQSLQVAPERCAVMGDDLPDLPAFAAAGLGIAVADAADEVRDRADWVTRASGGRGAVREVCEAVLRARGDWQRFVAALPTRATIAPA